jgi:hypothetical protein
LRDHHVGLGERRVDGRIIDGAATGGARAARDGAEGDVIWEIRVEQRRLPGHPQFGIDDGRQHLVFNQDGVGGISGDVAVDRHDHGDRFADVADHVHGHRPMDRRGEGCADGHRREELGNLGAREDRLHAVHRSRGARVDGDDPAVSDVTALEGEVLQAGDFQVVDVGAAALNEARVLAAFHALAHELRQHRKYGHGSPLCCRGLNGVDDVLVAGAAAEVALDTLADLALRWLGVLVQQVDGRHDDARCAVTALQAMFLPKALLQGMQLTVLRQALDGHDLGAVSLDRENGAGLRAAPVDENRAGAALARVATDVRAGQEELLPQEVDEEHAWLDIRSAHPAVDRHRNLGHVSLFFPLFRQAP